MLTVAIGHSDDVDEEDAVAEIITQCKSQLRGKQPHAGIIFIGFSYDNQTVLKLILKHFPDIKLIGASTDGELSTVSGFTPQSIALTLLASDRLSFRTGYGTGIEVNSLQAAKDAIRRAQPNKNTRLCLTFVDGITANGDEIVRSLRSALPSEVPVFGGLAADAMRFQKTSQYCGNRILNDSVVVLLIDGPIEYSFGVSSGWKPLGKKRTVTKVERNIVYKLDDKPAIDLFKFYLGEYCAPLSLKEYPIAVFERDNPTDYIRSSFFDDPKTGAVTFVGEVPEHAKVQIMTASRDDILHGARISIEKSTENFKPKKPDLILAISCASRNEKLGTRTHEEIRVLEAIAPTNTPIVGMYSYGEISPYTDGNYSYFHNQTMITLLLREIPGE